MLNKHERRCTICGCILLAGDNECPECERAEVEAKEDGDA